MLDGRLLKDAQAALRILKFRLAHADVGVKSPLHSEPRPAGPEVVVGVKLITTTERSSP